MLLRIGQLNSSDSATSRAVGSEVQNTYSGLCAVYAVWDFVSHGLKVKESIWDFTVLQ